MIDDTLSWSAQIDKITKKVNSGLSIIKKLRDIVDYNTVISIYKLIIQPHFDYCSQVWGCLGKVLSVDKLQRLQNRAFRIISREGYETRSNDILNKAGFSDLQTRREQQLAVVMYKIKHKMLPNYLQDIFVNTQQVHCRNTRQREYNYALPMPNTNAMKKSFGYRGAEIWNSLPIELKSQKGVFSLFISKCCKKNILTSRTLFRRRSLILRPANYPLPQNEGPVQWTWKQFDCLLDFKNPVYFSRMWHPRRRSNIIKKASASVACAPGHSISKLE